MNVLKLSPKLERQEQALYFRWVETVTFDSEALRSHCYAVPNGGARRPVEAAMLKAQGVTAGVPDISVDVPSGTYHGLRIEMKRVGERATPEQLEHIARRRRMGYYAAVCEGFDEARRVTLSYLKMTHLVVDRWLN